MQRSSSPTTTLALLVRIQGGEHFTVYVGLIHPKCLWTCDLVLDTLIKETNVILSFIRITGNVPDIHLPFTEHHRKVDIKCVRIFKKTWQNILSLKWRQFGVLQILKSSVQTAGLHKKVLLEFIFKKRFWIFHDWMVLYIFGYIWLFYASCWMIHGSLTALLCLYPLVLFHAKCSLAGQPFTLNYITAQFAARLQVWVKEWVGSLVIVP